jgi:hypothetical protein
MIKFLDSKTTVLYLPEIYEKLGEGIFVGFLFFVDVCCNNNHRDEHKGINRLKKVVHICCWFQIEEKDNELFSYPSPDSNHSQNGTLRLLLLFHLFQRKVGKLIKRQSNCVCNEFT